MVARNAAFEQGLALLGREGKYAAGITDEKVVPYGQSNRLDHATQGMLLADMGDLMSEDAKNFFRCFGLQQRKNGPFHYLCNRPTAL